MSKLSTDTLKTSLKRVLKKNSIDSTLVLVREDGVIVFEQDKNFDLKKKQALGALMAGTWQAAEAMLELFPTENREFFRLGFDTSSSGIYMLPVHSTNEKFFIGLFFKNEMNPAILKNKLRTVSQEIIDELKIYFKGRESVNKPLFENITDAEISKIFSFAGV